MGMNTRAHTTEATSAHKKPAYYIEKYRESNENTFLQKYFTFPIFIYNYRRLNFYLLIQKSMPESGTSANDSVDQWLIFLEWAPHIKRRKPKTERQIFFHDEYVIQEGVEISHKELERNKALLRNTIQKLVRNSYVFNGIAEETLLRAIVSWKVPIVEIVPNTKIILENDDNCDFFYVLLKWKVGIYKWSDEVWEIDKISVIGEIGYIAPEGRKATVITKERSFFMRFDRVFIENNLSYCDKEKIYINLIRELVHKLSLVTSSLKKTRRKLKGWNGGDTVVTPEMAEEIKSMVFHTVENTIWDHPPKKKAN